MARIQFVFLSLLIAGPLGAEDLKAQPTGPIVAKATVLSLEDALKEALEQSPLLGAFQAESDSRQARIGPESALEDPMIKFELEDYPASSFNPHKMADAGNKFSLSQKLPFPGKRAALKEAASEEFHASAADLEAKRREIKAILKRRYFVLALTHAVRDLIEDEQALVKSNLSVARNNYTLGKVPQSDVLTLQVEVANLIDQQLERDRMIEETRTEINQLLGRPGNDNWQPQRLASLSPKRPMLSEESLLTQVLASNPELKGLEATKRAASARENLARRNYYPDLEFMMAYTARSQGGVNDGTDSVTGGIGLTIPLWQGSKQDELAREAAAQKSKATAMLTEGKNSVAHNLHSLLARIHEIDQRLALARQALLPLTEAAVSTAQKSYAVGAVEISSVLSLIRSRYQAQVNYQTLLAEQAGQLAELDRLVGESPSIAGAAS